MGWKGASIEELQEAAGENVSEDAAFFVIEVDIPIPHEVLKGKIV